MAKKDDIRIAGKTLGEISQERLSISREALKLISDAIDDGTAAIHALADEEDIEKVSAHIQEATELFNLAEAIANATGVEYYMDEYSRLSSQVDELRDSSWIKAATSEILQAINNLENTLQEMEYNSDGWNSSSC